MIRFTTVIQDEEEAFFAIGFVPSFLSEDDPRPAREQLDANYAHGGGWRPHTGQWKLHPVKKTLHYPGDRPLHPLASGMLRNELIVIYEASFVMILQTDGTFEVARMD